MPASKSHTIRALIISTLARGESEILHPLDSADTRSCLRACRALGADISTGDAWKVKGTAGRPRIPEDVINVGNSGTTARLIAGVATLGPHAGYTVITGDQQTRKRPMGTLITALNSLGAMVYSTTGDGTLPIVIRGKLRGGETTVEGVSSQFVSSLLLCCPLTEDNTVIYVNHLNERPYVEMTLWWLNKQGIHYQHSGLEHFEIMGGQRYQPFKERIAADFSSATFFLCAAAITGSELLLKGLDMEDPQGDKKVIEVLKAMGAGIDTTEEGITVRGGQLRGIEVDMNDIPDALPSLAVVGCMAEGKTVLRNVKHARLKETDRIKAMAQELTKLGARVEELEDGMVVHRSDLTGTQLNGHHDHRIVMSLAVAGLAATGTTTIDSAEAIAATFPNFAKLMVSAGADMALIKDK